MGVERFIARSAMGLDGFRESMEETMQRPFKCPVCNGKGFVAAGFYSAATDCYPVLTNETCPTCHGQGIVWAEDYREQSPRYEEPKTTAG